MTARKVQTLLTLTGIVFGTMGYIVISGIMLGFRVYLLEQLVNNDAHIKISPRVEIISKDNVSRAMYSESETVNWILEPGGRRDSSEIRNSAVWTRILNREPSISAYSKQLSIKVILSKGSQNEAARLIGIEILKHARVTNIRDNITKGDYNELSAGGNKVIIGEGLSDLLGLKLYDTINISSGFGKSLPFKIIGTFRTGNKAFDDSVCYSSLSDVQLLNRSFGKISGISIRLKDISTAKEKTKELSNLKLDKVESWEDTNASFLTIFKIQDTIRYSITIAILIVSGFGIYNILNVLINQKKREIAILRSIGYESGDILIIFLIQGVVLGVIGAIIGMWIGFIICSNLSNLNFSSPYLSTKTGKMLISYDLKIYFQAFSLAVIATLLASYLPAKSAGKLQPLEIIRGEI